MISLNRTRSCNCTHFTLRAAACLALLLAAGGCDALGPAAEQGGRLSFTFGDLAPADRSSAGTGTIDAAMRPDREAFHTTVLVLWDGEGTLAGSWIAHPDASIARRVRLTNDVTGAQTDAALIRRDSDRPGNFVIISSEAAKAVDLLPGKPTSVTIEALAYKTDEEDAATVDEDTAAIGIDAESEIQSPPDLADPNSAPPVADKATTPDQTPDAAPIEGENIGVPVPSAPTEGSTETDAGERNVGEPEFPFPPKKPALRAESNPPKQGVPRRLASLGAAAERQPRISVAAHLAGPEGENHALG